MAAAHDSNLSGQSGAQIAASHPLMKLAGLILAAVLIWLLVRAADWRAVFGEMRRSNILLLLCVWFLFGCSSWLLRALRWRLLLTAEKAVGFWPVFWANNAGNLGNVFLPARAGEFIRSAMVGAGSGITQRFVLATAACERIFDLLIFVTLAEFAAWYGAGIPPAILRAIYLAFLLALCGVAALLAASRSERWVHLAIARSLRRPILANRVQTYLEPVTAGLRTIHSWKQMTGFIGLSLLIWLTDVSGAKLVAYAMGFTLPFPVAFVMIAGLVLINLVPATPGQLGIYQWVVVHVLAISRIEYNQALAYSLVMQVSGYFVLSLLGVPGLMLYRRSSPQSEGLSSRLLGKLRTGRNASNNERTSC
jgi:glycosyltransferase 2 family protein